MRGHKCKKAEKKEEFRGKKKRDLGLTGSDGSIQRKYELVCTR